MFNIEKSLHQLSGASPIVAGFSVYEKTQIPKHLRCLSLSEQDVDVTRLSEVEVRFLGGALPFLSYVDPDAETGEAQDGDGEKGNDIGYVRAVQRSDGKMVAVPCFTDEASGPERYVGATIWSPSPDQPESLCGLANVWRIR